MIITIKQYLLLLLWPFLIDSLIEISFCLVILIRSLAILFGTSIFIPSFSSQEPVVDGAQIKIMTETNENIIARAGWW